MNELTRRQWLKWMALLSGSAAMPSYASEGPLTLKEDDVAEHFAPRLQAGSHVKIYIPNLPYIYTSHAINVGLIRPANNQQGWEYELATDIRQVSETAYDVTLREGIKFQDGTPFTAQSVVRNILAFRQSPFLFSKLHETLLSATALDEQRVRIYLSQRYGQFMNDLLWLHFYTDTYLEKFGWNGKATCPNLAEAGPYGLGPYQLIEGYVEGDRQTKEVMLKANPYYWRPNEPNIERITIYTELDSQAAINQVQAQEGQLDIAPIPFHDKVQTMRSPHSKVVSASSNNNFAIHLNLRNGHPRLQEQAVRVALNKAIHQANLLSFVYMDEGQAKATNASPNFPRIAELSTSLKPYSEVSNPYDPEQQAALKQILDGITLKVYSQRSFLWLWRGIAYQLGRVGVTLDIELTDSEKDIFAQLLTTNQKQNTKDWDLLIWSMDDWYFNHPWSVFVAYRTTSVWSTIMPDARLDGYIDALFAESVGSDAYLALSRQIMTHVYDQGYMLFVPAPNQVLATNKEVHYVPYPMATSPLWELKISRYHWSVREGALPPSRTAPLQIQRV
ncbi:ABC transporter substrate-binding protein [Thaumasiovibrio subtropicus]|uniref:ABC transporter substrate-binding protein n=1 Tax=Thaumasiovibrio subtropicus TaxID=1891207 RepID=UPI000B361993|nr:ABC transporter substrate-binding protein [Thaumasiovibrio subtropicus]